MSYDLIILGAGPAGYLAAERAGEAGLKTLLVEKKFLGGVCLNEGCIPTKTFLNSAKIYDKAKHGDKYGVLTQDITLDHQKVLKRKDKVVRTLVGGVKGQLKRNKVEIIDGYGKIVGKTIEGYQIEVGDKAYTGKKLLIATGSRPITPPIPGLQEGLDNNFVLTNREILDLKNIPEKLVIIGGGVIGLEMASYFNSAGSQVTVIEMLDHIAGQTDSDISKILLENYRNKGVEFKLNSMVVGINADSVVYQTDEQEETITADQVLLSIGRAPVIDNIGLETIGVEIENRAIKVDDRCRTNLPDVYAAGDVNGKSLLAHTAYREAEVCINNILGKTDLMRYNAIPAVIYTNPEVASVGETEATAREKGIDYEVANLSMRYSGRYLAENEGGKGICKVLVDKKHHKLIGVHMISNYASEIIYGAGLMIETEMRVDDIKEIIFPHPTVSEIIREGIFQL